MSNGALEEIAHQLEQIAMEQYTANLIALMQTPEFEDPTGSWSLQMKFRQELLKQVSERLGLE